MSWIPLRITNASPIAISRSCSRPACLARIGRHIMPSDATPSAAVSATATRAAMTIGRPIVTLNRKATYAPNVSMSPWAKLTSLSVP